MSLYIEPRPDLPWSDNEDTAQGPCVAHFDGEPVGPFSIMYMRTDGETLARVMAWCDRYNRGAEPPVSEAFH